MLMLPLLRHLPEWTVVEEEELEVAVEETKCVP